MSQSKSYQPTPEQIERWKRIDELEHGATAGFSTPEQDDKNVKEFLENDYIETQLKRLRAHRKKLIEKLKWTEDYEDLLLKEKEKRNQQK
ncbi:MAG: hypothetical protein MJK14_25095 [Rivularia sp. ALOHA_DT_140]|nr:hypothetical protein [Rivularia sp. ALOHA_DT_140]